MDSRCCPSVSVNRVASVDDLDLSFDRRTKFVDHFSQRSDLVQAVLPVLKSLEVEVKLYLLAAISNSKSDLVVIIGTFATDVLLAGVFDDRNDVSPHVGSQVQKLASLNVVLLVHYLFLKMFWC